MLSMSISNTQDENLSGRKNVMESLATGYSFEFGNGREEGEGRGHRASDLCAWIFSGQNISVVGY